MREGQNRPVNRQWWYIDYRQAVDAIKWRVYTIDKSVQGNSVPTTEKKEYFCTRCKAEWTQMEVLDNMDPILGFKCHRCENVLNFDPDRQAGGHEQSTRLNNQLKFITMMLPQLDSVVIPDNTFDMALSNSRPIIRDAQNQVAASTVVEDMAKPTAVKGVANTGPKSIAISITDSDGPTDAEKEAERLRKEAIAKSNALPEWHTTSTVTGISHVGSNNNSSSGTTIIRDDDEDKKQLGQDENDLSATDQAAVDEVFAMIQKQQAEEAARRAREEEEEEDDEEDDDEDDDEGEFEDINPTSAPAPSTGDKRPAPGTGTAPSSGTTSAADTPVSSGGDQRPAKKVKVAEPAVNGNGNANGNNGGASDDDEEDEDMAFEDV